MDYARLVSGAADAVGDALAGRARGIAVATSGSTGEPVEVLLSTDALRASAAATDVALGGSGHWLLGLPTDRIAGAMVLARAALGRTLVAGVAPGSFSAENFATAAARLPSDTRRYASLVPTQLRRVLETAEGRAALETFDAVLVGGAALSGDAPSNVVRTYGLTETAGGCVYDGFPIGDTEVRMRADGRLLIATSSLADDYAPARPDAWEEWNNKRWLVTSDLGTWAPDGKLIVTGRVDRVITTGGFKVHPRTVEKEIDALDWVKESAVIGVPNPEWGQVIAAVVVPADRRDMKRLWELREALEPSLPRHALPSEMILVEDLPRLPTGKVSYASLQRTVADLQKEQ